MTYMGKRRPNCEMGTFSRLQVWLKYMRGQGNLCHFGLQKDLKGLTEGFYGCEKVETISWFSDLFTV